MNLWLSLNKALTLYADKVALVDGEKRLTYAQFGQRVCNLLAGLRQLGMQNKSAVAILAPNCHEFMETYYACGISGAVLCPINYRLAPPEVASILDDGQVTILIVHTDFGKCVDEILSAATGVEHVIWIGGGENNESARNGEQNPTPVACHNFEELAQRSADMRSLNELPQLPADQLAHLYYTSGTTGKPKGVMLTQGNVTFNALAVVADLTLVEDDVWLHAAPLFHLADAWATFSITWVGGTHIFIPHFNPKIALSAIEKHKVTVSVLVPTMLSAMLNEQESLNADCSSLRLLLTGGSPIAPEVVRRATQMFGCEYVQLYGMTETSPFLTLSRPKSCHANLCLEEQLPIRSRTGRPYIGAEVRVVKTSGEPVANDDAEVGEIIARGPTIFAGYWNQPEATAETIRNGWIHTGDLATIDKDGFINIVDRAKDMIITGGENVYSNEVEYALYEHPAVLECAVFGIPDEYWGEAIKAVLVLRSGHHFDESGLTTFLRDRLANYKVPRSFEVVAELPKTGSGKIYKKGLREQYWRDRDKQVH